MYCIPITLSLRRGVRVSPSDHILGFGDVNYVPITLNLRRGNLRRVLSTAFIEKYGPYALIAGGSDGLGFAYAEALAKRGLSLVLIARQEKRLQAAADRLKEAYQVDVIPIVADMADINDVEAKIRALTQPIGLLVYNAAFAPIGPFEEKTRAELDMAAAVNMRGPLLLSKLLSQPMIERGRGGIILMSSLAGTQGSPTLVTYAATKSFNAILAEGLWKELRPHGINVLACMAGAILTPGYAQAETNSKPAPGSLRPEQVAETAVRALDKGKGPIVIPGAVNKIGRFALMRLLSRRAAIAVMGMNTGGLA